MYVTCKETTVSRATLSHLRLAKWPERNRGRAWQKRNLQRKGHKNPEEHTREEQIYHNEYPSGEPVQKPVLPAQRTTIREELKNQSIPSAQKCGGEGAVQDYLGSGEQGRSALPIRKCRNFGKKGAVRIVEEDTQEPSGFVARVLLEVGLDVYDEGGDRGSQQAHLYPKVSVGGLGNFTKLTSTRRMFNSAFRLSAASCFFFESSSLD